MRIFLLLLAATANPAIAKDQSGPREHNGGPYRRAVVAADHRAASAAGIEVFKRGGNVVDAAVAVSFALSVVRPESCGIGGGGFMLIWDATKQKSVAIDYRERACRKASRKMFVDPANPRKARTGLSLKGHLAAAVPGTVAGLFYAQKYYGRLDLKSVLAPAIRLARNGVEVDRQFRDAQATALREFERDPDKKRRFAVLWKRYLNSGRRWKQGERFYSPQLEVLELIAAQGPAGFYEGAVAKALIAESRRGNGLMTQADLSSPRPAVREALRARFDGMDVITMPPASSGGIALIETLNILTELQSARPVVRLHKRGLRDPQFLHLLTEAMKHAFADRAEFLGDADFVKVPVRRLTSRSYARSLAARIDLHKTRPFREYGRFQPVSDHGTSHFSVIDADGNAVACTETVNMPFGSYVVEPKYGIVFNNQMDDFAAIPGTPNAFGLLQSEQNAIAPGKKPLSSMTPTIVVKNGRAVHALGASGGPRIISSVIQVLWNLTRRGMTPSAAVEAPRFHHQWMPDVLFLEEPLLKPLSAELRKRGHTIKLKNKLSAVQAVSRASDGLYGASDRRKGGLPAGY